MKIDHIDFLLAIVIVLIAASFSAGVYMHWIRMSVIMGQFRFSHWLTIIGTTYIAVATPVFVVLKRFYPQRISGLFRFHIFGNLLFFALISIHFANQMGRPAANFPELGTGLALYIALTLQVASGFTQRFISENRYLMTNKFIHASLIIVFYLVILFHVLHGLGIT